MNQKINNLFLTYQKDNNYNFNAIKMLTNKLKHVENMWKTITACLLCL
jgi:hypothetical protein